MRICFLAPASSSHMVKWCGYFASKGHDVHVVSFDDGRIEGAQIHRLSNNVNPGGSDFGKLAYLTCWREARATIRSIAPDAVNAHYATSYGLLAALACKRPYVLSVWGSDIYDFPNKSSLHKAALKYSLAHAAKLFSTSRAMADEAAEYTDKSFNITPFGVDMSLFHPRPRDHGNDFVISIVKSLSPKYGIDVLIEAVAEVVARRSEIPLKVRIAGKGSDEQMLKGFASGLGIQDRIEWLGYISQEEAARVWADADVGIVPSSSSSESFGVAAVEAQACGTPVIIADTPGLMEATAPGKSSLVFPRRNAHELANCIIKMHDNPQMRCRLGGYGVQYVGDHYAYQHCFNAIEQLLEAFVAENGGYHA